jgi:hypothetical protein
MVLLHGVSGKIPMHFMKLYFHGLKGTTQLSFGNLSTTANISMSISNSVGIADVPLFPANHVRGVVGSNLADFFV